MNDMVIGASFSHRYLSSLGINTHQALDAYLELGFKWIRLGCYWDEIERERGVYDFHIIEECLAFCEQHAINVVLTVGMKAPRYPEYYIPQWLENNPKEHVVQVSCLTFIKKTVQTLRRYSSINVWQVENEPLDPSGPEHISLSEIFLIKEIETVRNNASDKKMMVTFWANDLLRRNYFKQIVDHVDIIGLDMYPRQPVKMIGTYFRYMGPRDKQQHIRKTIDEIKTKGKEVWIAELQAEPWEPNEIHTNRDNPPSCLPHHLNSNFNYGLSLRPNAIFLWGFEWWYERKLKGDTRYWNEVSDLLD